jgi:gas vesicle protein
MRVKGQKEKDEDAQLRKDRIARTKEFINYSNEIEDKGERELKEIMYKIEVVHDQIKDRLKRMKDEVESIRGKNDDKSHNQTNTSYSHS